MNEKIHLLCFCLTFNFNFKLKRLSSYLPVMEDSTTTKNNALPFFLSSLYCNCYQASGLLQQLECAPET